MKVKGITDECFSDYKLPSMFIAFPTCTFKCDKENGCAICQNGKLINEPDIDVAKEDLVEHFIRNPISEAIVMGGLEPFDSILDVISFVDCARRVYECDAPIVIYTGYTEDEIQSGRFYGDAAETAKNLIKTLLQNKNIVVKYGRFKPNQEPHFDPILGVVLASPNQYAKAYNMEIPNEPQKF